ncbi:MAG: aminopeptidase [Thermomicrobiales bacterium]|nr:aminopeptidase [Thermomicrobiales bacterium]
MPDSRLETWAKALVNFSVEVKPGQSVVIIGGAAGEPLMRAVFKEVVAAGGHPIPIPIFSGMNAPLLQHGTDEQIAWISPIERLIRTEADVVINILADTNTKSLSGVDPAKQRQFSAARADLVKTFMERDADGSVDWTITLYPTDAYAQDADMATEEYAEFVYGACKLNTPDPVAAWNELAREQQRLIEWLSDKDEIHLSGPGTDLRLSTKGRTWINADGRKNFPDGEVFTGPVETSVNGTVRFSFPAIMGGREVVDIRLTFKDGKVVEASAAKGEEYLLQTIDTDEGARFLGEFAFGTNYDIQRFSKNILFDEKIGGTVHMALGAGYPGSGSTNQSAIHWDMICDLRDGGQVDVDGIPFMRGGKFVV